MTYQLCTLSPWTNLSREWRRSSTIAWKHMKSWCPLLRGFSRFVLGDGFRSQWGEKTTQATFVPAKRSAARDSLPLQISGWSSREEPYIWIYVHLLIVLRPGSTRHTFETCGEKHQRSTEFCWNHLTHLTKDLFLKSVPAVTDRYAWVWDHFEVKAAPFTPSNFIARSPRSPQSPQASSKSFGVLDNFCLQGVQAYSPCFHSLFHHISSKGWLKLGLTSFENCSLQVVRRFHPGLQLKCLEPMKFQELRCCSWWEWTDWAHGCEIAGWMGCWILFESLESMWGVKSVSLWKLQRLYNPQPLKRQLLC